MKLVEINWDPTNRQLRQFGVNCLFALPFVGWIWGAGLQTIGLLALSGLLLAIVGAALPRAVKPVFLALMIVATPIGMVIGELAMLIVFFGVFLPFGLVFRILRRDALQLTLSRQAKSYWQTKKQPNEPASYYRQF